MNMKLRMTRQNWLCAIFVFDCAVLPVIKIAGQSVKISYGIALVYILLLSIRMLKRSNMGWGSTNTIFWNLILYIILIFFGELWSAALYGISMQTNFIKIMIGIVFMIGSLYYGYVCKARLGKSVFWIFVLNVVVNCILALLGRAAPAFITKLYSVSVETFSDGYYRNGGIIGNPNATLLVTNISLLLVVILFRYDKLKLSNIEIAVLYLLSIAADIIVSSRGELLHTLLILSYFTYWLVRKNRDSIKLLKRIGLISIIIVLAIGTLWGIVVQKYPNIQLSIERMTSIDNMLNASEDASGLSSIARPLYKLDVFWSRFRHSPLWGTGIDGGGNIPDFVKGTTGYHNDFFLILGASGVLGLVLWLKIIVKTTRRIGVCMLFPFFTTAISNTFLQSYFGMMLYFFTIGYVFSFMDREINT